MHHKGGLAHAALPLVLQSWLWLGGLPERLFAYRKKDAPPQQMTQHLGQ